APGHTQSRAGLSARPGLRPPAISSLSAGDAHYFGDSAVLPFSQDFSRGRGALVEPLRRAVDRRLVFCPRRDQRIRDLHLLPLRAALRHGRRGVVRHLPLPPPVAAHVPLLAADARRRPREVSGSYVCPALPRLRPLFRETPVSSR